MIGNYTDLRNPTDFDIRHYIEECGADEKSQYLQEFLSYMECMAVTSSRMQAKFGSDSRREFEDFTEHFGIQYRGVGETSLVSACFLTDQPECLGLPEFMFHVTGLHAVETLKQRHRLVPSIGLEELPIATHKGYSLVMIQNLLEALEIDMGHLDSFLFSGRQIDAEMIRHLENLNGMTVRDFELKLLSLFSPTSAKLHDFLYQTLDILQSKGRPADNTDLKEQIDLFILGLNKLTGLRSEWLVAVQDSLYGDRPVSNIDLLRHVLTTFVYFAPQFATDETPIKPALLVLNTKKFFSTHQSKGINPTLLSVRDPDAVMTALFIDHSCVEQIITCDFDEISRELYLGGVLPSEAKMIPFDPLCARSYRQGKIYHSAWERLISEGLIAPAFSTLTGGTIPYTLKLLSDVLRPKLPSISPEEEKLALLMLRRQLPSVFRY